MQNNSEILFIGGSSEIALKILNKLKNKYLIHNISRKQNNSYKINYVLKDYSNSNIKKTLKLIKKKFKTIIIFNGVFELSTLSNIDEKKFINLLKINVLTPLRLVNNLIKKDMLESNSRVFFLSSKAANRAEIGNAYYAISKNTLNFIIKILNKEHQKKKIKFINISAGIVESVMGKKVKQLMDLKKKGKFNKKTLKIKDLIKKFQLSEF